MIRSTPRSQGDVRSIGTMVLALADPSSTPLATGSLNLGDTENWSESFANFVRTTEKVDCDQLLQVSSPLLHIRHKYNVASSTTS